MEYLAEFQEHYGRGKTIEEAVKNLHEDASIDFYDLYSIDFFEIIPIEVDIHFAKKDVIKNQQE